MNTPITPVDFGDLGSDPDVMSACWDGLALIDAGWRPRRMAYGAADGVAVLTVRTPGGRVVPVTHPAASRDVMRAGLPAGRCADLMLRLAATVARIGERGGEGLEYLAWYWTGQCGRERVATRDDAIPDPALSSQPRRLRIAFWLLATVVCELGWRVSDLGEQAAGGGFVADIPGEVTAIFPAGMTRDGTTGGELAWILRGMNASAMSYLRRQDECTLSRARAVIARAAA